MPAARMPEIAAAIVPAYVEGLHAEGIHDQDAAARDAFVTGVLLRSGFDWFLYELLGSRRRRSGAAFDERIELCRALVELYRPSHAVSGSTCAAIQAMSAPCPPACRRAA